MGGCDVKGGDLRALAAAPLLLYAAAVLLDGPLPANVITPVTLGGVVGAAGVALLARNPGRWFAGIAAALAGAFVGLALAPGALGPWLVPLLLGALLAAPLVALALLWALRGSTGAGIFAVTATLVVGAAGLAVRRSVPPAGAASVGGWTHAVLAVAGRQVGAFLGGGGGASAPAGSLAYTGDLVFDLLAIVALGGGLASMLVIGERLVDLPAGGARAGTPAVSVSVRPGAPGFDAAVAEVPGNAHFVWGTASLAATLGAVVVFTVINDVSPTGAAVALAASVVATTGTMLAVGGRRGRRAAASAEAGSGVAGGGPKDLGVMVRTEVPPVERSEAVAHQGRFGLLGR